MKKIICALVITAIIFIIACIATVEYCGWTCFIFLLLAVVAWFNVLYAEGKINTLMEVNDKLIKSLNESNEVLGALTSQNSLLHTLIDKASGKNNEESTDEEKAE